MDPRGLAGYYSAHLLEKRDDGRWLCLEGRDRHDRLTALAGVVALDPDGPPEQEEAGRMESVIPTSEGSAPAAPANS